ncbi:MAG: YihY/virulence factor BrkB family protein [Nodosilinea sp.]
MIDYIRSQLWPSKPVQLLYRTGMKWQQDDCPGMSAALSYYALFSLFPILLVILSVIGALIGPETDYFEQINATIKQFLPPEVHQIIESTLLALNTSSLGAGLIGFGLLLFSASTVFSVLSNSVDQIWHHGTAPDAPASIKQSVLTYGLNKLFAFVLVLGTALVLLLSLVSKLVIQTLLQVIVKFEDIFPAVNLNELQLASALQLGSSWLILALAALVLLRFLPSTRVPWRDIWPAALLVGGLLVLLQYLVSNSVISIGSQFLSYGVIGSVMILMLWIYLTFQIFLTGCAFSVVYSHLFGSRRHQNREF